MPGLSRFSRKQPLSQESNTAGDKDGTTPAPPAGNGDGGAPPAVPPPSSNSGGNAEEPSNGGGEDAAVNFSTSLEDRPSTSGSNAFADFGNMFTIDDEHNGVNSNMMLDSTFLSSTPTEGGMGDGGMMVNSNMFGDNSFMQGFESRPSTGEGGDAFQFGGMNGFDSEGVDAEQQPTTANGDNETNGAEAKRPADAPSASAAGGIGGGNGGGIGIGFFAKRRAVPAASTAATSNPAGQTEIAKANSSPPKNDGLTSTASSVANLSQFDTNLLSENKNENEAPSSGNVQIPKSIATSGGDVEDDLTVGTTTSVAAAAMGGVVNAAPPAAKSPYFSGAGAVNQSQSDIHARNATPESSPSKEEIIIPGMNVSAEKSGDNADMDVTAETTKKQGGVLAPNASSSHTQRVSLSPPDAKMNQAATNVNANSIVIPGVTNNDNVDVAQTMMQLGGATKGKTPTAVSTANNTQRVNGAFTSSSALGNNARGGIGRFNSTEKVKFTLPESTTKTVPMKSTANMNMANTTAITPDHRNRAKQASTTPYTRPSASFGPSQQNAVTPTPHKTVQYDSAPRDRVVPCMPTAEKHDETSNELRTDVDLQDRNQTKGDSVRSPTPTMKNDVTTPKASNLNTGGGYSGSSVLTTHESFDELLSQLDGDLTEATDLHNKGNLDLLHLEVALTHAYAKALQTKGQYVDLLDEIDAVSSLSESIMIELEG